MTIAPELAEQPHVDLDVAILLAGHRAAHWGYRFITYRRQVIHHNNQPDPGTRWRTVTGGYAPDVIAWRTDKGLVAIFIDHALDLLRADVADTLEAAGATIVVWHPGAGLPALDAALTGHQAHDDPPPAAATPPAPDPTTRIRARAAAAYDPLIAPRRTTRTTRPDHEDQP